MSSTSVKAAFVFLVVLASPTASFAWATGQEEATDIQEGADQTLLQLAARWTICRST
jgi:hypothetical protein